jgi:hypothetical protein
MVNKYLKTRTIASNYIEAFNFIHIKLEGDIMTVQEVILYHILAGYFSVLISSRGQE